MKYIPTSLFGRMMALSLLATLAALIIAAVAIGGVLERFITSGVDARLSDRLAALVSAVRPDGTIDGSQLKRVTARLPANEPWRIDLPELHIGTQDRAGDLMIAFDDDPHWRGIGPIPPPHRPPQPMPPFAGGRPFDARQHSGDRVHGLLQEMPTGKGMAILMVAVPRREIDRPVLAALAPLAASLAILALALGGAALLQLRIGLRPLTELQDAVEAIRQGRTAHISKQMPDELVPLARELNALAIDAAAALEGVRTSAANLAHALKTPIATLGLQLAGDTAAQTQIARINATLRHHLGRARASATNRRSATPLAPALGDLVAAIAALHADRVTIDLDVESALAIGIAPQDLDELAGNLIDNAAKHAVSRVLVSARRVERSVLLTVSDDGPGIPARDRARATTPGVRLDERGAGHGFGLAIARELAELYGGTLELTDAPGGGLFASAWLPYSGETDVR